MSTEKAGKWMRFQEEPIAIEGAIYDVRFADGSVRRRCRCLTYDAGDFKTYAYFVPVNAPDRAMWGQTYDFDEQDYHWQDVTPTAIRLRRHQPADLTQ
jgi:hypothetical protein